VGGFITGKLHIKSQGLFLPLKTTVRHASATRRFGESLWVEANRGEVAGFGEGCPRPYVTGERVKTSLAWLEQQLPIIEKECQTMSHLKNWAVLNAASIDENPSSWCAVECALLDLFARENNKSVGQYIGREESRRRYVYSAVLGDDKEWKFKVLLDQYMVRGFSNFKIKLNGNAEQDNLKLKNIYELGTLHGISDIRVRLDANNLWKDNPEAAFDHLESLEYPFVAIEEPVHPCDVETMSEISLALGVPVILDESLCTLDDLSRFDQLPGQFIANVKVSRVGGVLRALKMIDAIKEKGWPIIISANVGETSVLTRAAHILAGAAGDHLIAQEGGFGNYLLRYEPVAPSLKYGRHGIMDLDQPYVEKTIHGLQVVMPDAWQNNGWGLNCRSTRLEADTTVNIGTVTMSDNYDIHYRRWGPENGDEVLMILHGGLSHSEWQTPLAQAFRLTSDMTVVAVDRRGCGLNAHKGDLGTFTLAIQDVVEHLKGLKKSYKKVYLAGWCQGAQFASVAAEKLQDSGVIDKLILITPGLFWNDRFRSVIDTAEKMVDSLVTDFDLSPDRDNAFVPIPLEASDFTFSEKWLDYIEQDTLKSTKITMKSVFIMDEVQEMSWISILNITLPIFAILATKDRIVDNEKVGNYLSNVISHSPNNRITTIESAHAVQFEKPHELAKLINDFIVENELSPPTDANL